MKNSSNALGFLTLLLAAAMAAPAHAGDVVTPAAPSAVTDDETSLFLSVGGQVAGNVDDLGRGRFEKYREVPDGAVFDYGRFEWLPKDRAWTLSVTAADAARKDQRYLLQWTDPASFRINLGYAGLPRYYSASATTLWSGAGTALLTTPDVTRAAFEAAAGPPTSFAVAPAIASVVNQALASSGQGLDLRVERKQARGDATFKLGKAVSVRVAGRYEQRDGTKPLGFGTYIRRQGLSGQSGTGAGFFWRETIEARGLEVVEPVDYTIPEADVSATWSGKGQTLTVGWEGSWFKNDTSAVYFDNPFESPTGRASATVFDPRSDQEPASPNGNNQLRGLTARSVMQLAPDNTFQQFYGNGSFKLGGKTRLATALSYGTLKQDDPFLPYAENDQVVFSGTAGQPGVVYARHVALPRASLDGRIGITRADLRLTSHPFSKLNLRAAYRYYDYDDSTAAISFPGYSSSGDSFFRRSIGQRDETGNRVLVAEPGGYRRQRMTGAAAYRLGKLSLDGEYNRTQWDYDHRQVEGTTENSVKGTLRYNTDEGLQLSAFYLKADRTFDGTFDVGLEASGVRAFDVWKRNRNQAGADLDVPAGDHWTFNVGASYTSDEFPDAVPSFPQPYGLQDSKSSSVYGGASYGAGDWTFGVSAGHETYTWNSLQVTKTSLGADYNPIDRWERGLDDRTYWAGANVSGKLGKKAIVGAQLDFQKYQGDWTTENLGTPDVNSAVAYAFPGLSDSIVTAKLSVIYNVSPKLDVEARYWYEPYRLDDFTWDLLQPYMQGILQETQASPSSIGNMNVSRMLWLDSRYGDYDAHTVAAFLRMRF